MEDAGAVEFAEEVAEAVEEHGLEVSVFLGRADYEGRGLVGFCVNVCVEGGGYRLMSGAAAQGKIIP